MWVLDQKGTSLYEVDSIHAIDSKVYGKCRGDMVVLGEYYTNSKARESLKLIAYMLQTNEANHLNYLYKMYEAGV